MTTIAVAGHNNWGKSTLIRTMTKGTFGVVDDIAGSTSDVTRVDFSSLRVTFLDCPGFDQANTILKLAKMNGGSLASVDLDDPDFLYDARAIRAVQGADVAIYLCSLETSPSPAIGAELQILRLANPLLLAVINKREQQVRALGSSGAEKRARQWRELLKLNGIDGVFDFDSHWDSFSKLKEVFRHIATILPESKAGVFKLGLTAFEEELTKKRLEAARLCAGCVRASRALVESVDSDRHDYNVRETRSKLRAQIGAETAEISKEFIAEVRALYAISVEPGDANLSFSEKQYKKAGDRIAAMATHSAVGAAVATLIGGALGALLGPVGAAAGATLGAKVGAGLGAGAGLVSGAVTETNTHMEVRLSASYLREVAVFCLATLWCLTHQGFGKSPVVVKEDFQNSLEAVRSRVGRIRHPEWEIASDRTMTDWFEEHMAALEI